MNSYYSLQCYLVLLFSRALFLHELGGQEHHNSPWTTTNQDSTKVDGDMLYWPVAEEGPKKLVSVSSLISMR